MLRHVSEIGREMLFKSTLRGKNRSSFWNEAFNGEFEISPHAGAHREMDCILQASVDLRGVLIGFICDDIIPARIPIMLLHMSAQTTCI